MTNVNDEARELALGGLEESVQRQLHEADQLVTEQILEIQQRRDERIVEIEREREASQDGATQRRTERMAELSAAETAVSKTLRENAGLVLTADVVFEPTGEVLARQGQIADDSMSADLERMAREFRELVSRNAQDEVNQIAQDAERDAERAAVEAEGQITSIQDDHKRKVDELRAGNETQRRKLESLKRNDLLQEAEYRDLKNFEWELRDANPDLPDLFEAGMGAEAVQTLLEGVDLEALAVKLRAGDCGGGALEPAAQEGRPSG